MGAVAAGSPDGRKLALYELVSTGPSLHLAAGSLWKGACLDEHDGEHMEIVLLRYRRSNGGSQFVDAEPVAWRSTSWTTTTASSPASGTENAAAPPTRNCAWDCSTVRSISWG